jgi:hypothetical protein
VHNSTQGSEEIMFKTTGNLKKKNNIWIWGTESSKLPLNNKLDTDFL